MRPQIIGRVLGTGLRVAGRIAGERLAGAADSAAGQQIQSRAQAPAQTITSTVNQAQATGRAVKQNAMRAGGGVTRGVGGFLRPFRRVGGILWLEVTGVFFFLPVVVFGPTLWRMRASWAHGPDHRMFLITAGVVVLFLYLGVSSFWRARRR